MELSESKIFYYDKNKLVRIKKGFMGLRIFLEKTVGKNCVSIDDGEKVLQLIRPELTKGFTVEVDFEGVKLILTPFLNACFGKLLKQFGREVTMTHVSMRNVSDEFLQRINKFISRKDAEFTQSNDREMLQEMFDEDDLTDASL